jgi:hypothetical protein
MFLSSIPGPTPYEGLAYVHADDLKDTDMAGCTTWQDSAAYYAQDSAFGGSIGQWYLLDELGFHPRYASYALCHKRSSRGEETAPSFLLCRKFDA